MAVFSTSSTANLATSSPTTLNGTMALPMSTPWMIRTRNAKCCMLRSESLDPIGLTMPNMSANTILMGFFAMFGRRLSLFGGKKVGASLSRF
ncbi:hypothetical protein ACSBR2_004889 [Camellia fascicularis]